MMHVRSAVPRQISAACLLAAALSALGLLQAARAAEPELPELKVSQVRRVFHNGEHNAFTDLCRFHDNFYLTFRSCPDGHGVHPSASILVLRSRDAQDWEIVQQFHVPRRDTRDPHFLIFQNTLFVYTGTWFCGDTSPETYEMNRHLGYAVWSADGSQWHGPEMLEGTYGHYIWRAATHGGKAYLCGRRKREFTDAPRTDRSLIESAMLESDDGLIWRHRTLFQETWGDETAFLFEPDGAILAVARRGSTPAELCRAQPPYTEWTRSSLGRYIGGPLVVKWGDRYLVGGRNTLETPGPRTALYWLQNEQLVPCAELPSGGDNSYPGFVALNDREAMLSWYSSHERNQAGDPITAIYMAHLEIIPADAE